MTRLDGFFRQLPKDFRYAVEIRNAGLLGPRYRKMLDKHGVAHVYNHWSSMPALADQHTRLEAFTAPFTVLRLLTPLKMSYEAAKKRAEPYTKIVERTTRDETRDGGARQEGRSREPASLCVGQQSFRGECAVDGPGVNRFGSSLAVRRIVEGHEPKAQGSDGGEMVVLCLPAGFTSDRCRGQQV